MIMCLLTRNAVILAVICALAGALYYVVFGDSLWISSSAMQARSANADEMYTLYRARRDIPEGTLVWQNDFEPFQVNQSQIPQDAISKIALVDGRQAKFGLSRRQIVSYHDLDPDPFRAVVVRAKTVIPKGVVIDATMLEEVKRSEQVPHALSPVSVIGERTKTSVQKGQYFSWNELVRWCDK